MKKIIALSIAMVLAISFSVFSQSAKKPKSADGKMHSKVETNAKIETNREGGKMHIKVEIDKDGKTTKVDTTINTEDLAALNEQLEKMNIHVGTLENFGFAFATDEEKLQEEMKALEEGMKNTEFDAKALEEQMRLLEKEISDSTMMFKYKIKTNSDSGESLIELEKELGNMNFNFSDDHGGTQTITIDGDNVKIDGDKGGKEIIIKKESPKPGKKNDKEKKENKEVIIIIKSSAAPQKERASFAAEPVKDENQSTSDDVARVRFVEKKDNDWLNELVCYPNPSTGEFTLSFRLSNPQPAELKIMDIAGREVLVENIPENSSWVKKQIKLPANSSAAYLLILRQGSNWHHEKIFVRN